MMPPHTVFRLPPCLSRLGTSYQKARFSRVTEVTSDWLLDCGELTRIDRAGLELLLEVRNRVLSSGYRLAFINVPDELADLISLVEAPCAVVAENRRGYAQ